MNDEIVGNYVTWLRSWGASDKTVDARAAMAKSRLAAWGISGITTDNITDFLGNPKLKPWSRSTYYAHLTCFCAWLVATDCITENPMDDVRRPRRPSPVPRPLSEPEVQRVMAVAKGEQRDWLQLALLAGLRAGEIARVRGEDVTVEGIYVLGKGGKVDILPCHDHLWEMAQRYPSLGYWFPGSLDGHIPPQHISLGTGRLFRSLGIYGSIHRARHVYGTRLLRSGTNIRTVQRLMRHASLQTTANYTAVDENEMRAAIDKLSA